LSLTGKKILVASDFLYPDGFGGANKVAYYTARGLREVGADVRLLVRAAAPELPEREFVDGMPTFRYLIQPKSALRSGVLLRGKIHRLLQHASQNPNGPFDGVIAHQPLTAGAILGHPLVRKAAWIYNFHSPWDQEYRLKGRHNGGAGCKRLQWGATIRRIAEARVLKRCCRIIVLSQFIQQQLEATHGLGGRALVIPGGVDTGMFRPAADRRAAKSALGWPQDRLVLLTVRNLRPRTGVENLIRAAGRLRLSADRIQIVIVGSGPMTDELKRMVAARSLEPAVAFAGRVPEEKLAVCYQAADMFVLPTESLEGFGMATVEALASGLPVLGTPVGATPEILSSVGAEWLTRDNSPAALAEKIDERTGWIRANPEAYESLRRRCRDLAEAHYRWTKIFRQWRDCCCAAIAECSSALDPHA